MNKCLKKTDVVHTQTASALAALGASQHSYTTYDTTLLFIKILNAKVARRLSWQEWHIWIQSPHPCLHHQRLRMGAYTINQEDKAGKGLHRRDLSSNKSSKSGGEVLELVEVNCATYSISSNDIMRMQIVKLTKSGFIEYDTFKSLESQARVPKEDILWWWLLLR